MTVDPRPSSTSSSIVRQRTRLWASRMRRPHSSADSSSAADFGMTTSAQRLSEVTPNPALNRTPRVRGFACAAGRRLPPYVRRCLAHGLLAYGFLYGFRVASGDGQSPIRLQYPQGSDQPPQTQHRLRNCSIGVCGRQARHRGGYSPQFRRRSATSALAKWEPAS